MIERPQVWVVECAARFWAAAGDPPPFPRDLRPVLSWLNPLHVVEVPHLTLAAARDHFARHNVPCPASAEDRQLTGCFGAHGGVGVILFDPTLEADELRFTLAHEVAHYLRDYDAPRRRAARVFGARALEVLDGLRPAAADERLAGVLRGGPVRALTHFLDRDRWGRVVTAETRDAEAAADRLAYELLAPFDAVETFAASGRAPLAEHLRTDFGLPLAEAAKYAAILVR